MPPVFLDNHSTTRCDPRVVDAVLPFFTEHYGNAASRSHAFGWRARDAVEAAREHVGRLVGATAPSREIVFTSGATESDDLAILGVAHHHRDHGDHVITQKTEHPAVLDACRRLAAEGFRVTWLDVDGQGRVDPADVARAIDDRTLLVSVMLANNEVGTVQDVGAIGEITRERGVLFHVDAVQGLGHLPFDVDALRVDLASFTAHKLHGPKGVGALYVRRAGPRVRLEPQMLGGGHERGLRSGTLNVPGIVGFGEAARLLLDGAGEDGAGDGRGGDGAGTDRIRALRDRLLAGLRARVPGVTLNGADPDGDGPRSLGLARHPGNLHLAFEGVSADALLVRLKDDVALSTGSACASGTPGPSHVLRAMGVPDEVARSSVRFGLSRFTTEPEIARVVDATAAAVHALRG